MNEIRIELTKKDMQTAINEYLHNKYPNFQPSSMWLEYNHGYQGGYVKGALKPKE